MQQIIGPHAMYYTETVLAIMVALCYIIIVKWMVSWLISNLTGLSSYVTDWIGYVVVVVLTPTILLHFLGYEITDLTLVIFVAYSVIFMSKQIIRYSNYDV